MEDSNDDIFELNEVSWWSHWTEVVWFGREAYLLASKDFEEYFFNRAGFLKVTPHSGSLIEGMESEFQSRGLIPHVFVQNDVLHPALLQKFAKRGYRIADQMSVMEMDEPCFSVNKDLVMEMGNKERVGEWVDVYLRAFYGSTELAPKVTSIIRRVSVTTEAGLLLAYLDGKAVGALAIYRSPGLCGVYCVGTVPEARGKRVASTMLDFAYRLATREERRLILQTILSDSVESLYTKLGFNRVHLKELFVKAKKEVA